MQGAGYKTTFGHKREAALRTDSRANDRLQTVAGGVITFSGSSGLGAGVGGDWLLVDDLFKNSEEAASETTRNAKWRAYNVDCKSRLNSQECPIVMIGSRRNEDDVQGRIFDPTNPHYDAQEAARWVRIRLPALSEGEDVDPLKRPIDAPLWPERFDQAFFFEKRNSASDIIRDDFQTQYQCRPRPEEGTWFKKAWLKTYRTAELPKHLRIYVASDHAYRMKDKNDATCLLVVGMDATGAVYVLPDTFWRKCETDVMVDAMFTIARRHKVAMWWAARDAISGSLEPFIRRRMKDERCYFPLDDSIAESRDLVARSSSIRGMMARGEVYWPYEWPQWSQAEQQLLSFPAAHDDLVAALAMLGMGLERMVKAEGPKQKDLPVKGSYEWHCFGQENKDAKSGIWA
jgi:predicted phage terminase large subunit-like protein